jgi:hypothetical protein
MRLYSAASDLICKNLPQLSSFHNYSNGYIMFAVPPSVMESGESRVEVIEGDSVVIACPPIDAIPPPQIQWLKVTVISQRAYLLT